MTKEDKIALSKAINIMLDTKDITFEQMSGKNCQKVFDALVKINDKS